MNRFDTMSVARLGELLAGFPRARIAVVGDYFLDKYLDVDPALAEVSLETGKTAHQVVGIRHSPGAAGTIVASLDALLPQVDAVIALDQVEEPDCGVITTAIFDALAQRAGRFPHVIFWADSRRRIRQYRQVITKANQFEAVGWESPPPDARVSFEQLQDALKNLRTRTGAPVVVTRGGEGIVVTDPELTLVPGVRVDGPIDTTGAGDSTTAGAALPEAALIGNLVASITIQQLATTGAARPEDLPPRLEMWLGQRE